MDSTLDCTLTRSHARLTNLVPDAPLVASDPYVVHKCHLIKGIPCPPTTVVQLHSLPPPTLTSMMTSSPRTYLRSLVRVRLNHTQAQPVFKREGPAALKSDPHRFDNGSNSPQFPMEAQKRRTMKEAFPNAPTATRRAEPEPESPAGQSGSFSDHRGGGPRVAGEQRTHTEEAAHTSTIVHAAKKVKNAFTGKRAYSTKPTYTTADAPISSRQPRPAAPEGAVPSGQTTNASTKAGAPHKDVHIMARGAQE